MMWRALDGVMYRRALAASSGGVINVVMWSPDSRSSTPCWGHQHSLSLTSFVTAAMTEMPCLHAHAYVFSACPKNLTDKDKTYLTQFFCASKVQKMSLVYFFSSILSEVSSVLIFWAFFKTVASIPVLLLWRSPTSLTNYLSERSVSPYLRVGRAL